MDVGRKWSILLTRWNPNVQAFFFFIIVYAQGNGYKKIALKLMKYVSDRL